MSLKINNLSATIKDENKKVLNHVNLEIMPGEVHVLMGRNGSGKSSLSKVLMGHPDYEVTSGKILVDKNDITELEPNERANLGLFLATQYPTEVPGVNLTNFLRLAYNSNKSENKKLSIYQFRKKLRETLPMAGLDDSFMGRNLNEGFSGGEKKKCEILQMLILEPKFAILDETDSGLDMSSTKTIFTTIAEIAKKQKNLGLLVITHYLEIFNYIQPNFLHIFEKGQVTKSGGKELIAEVKKSGY